jgi:two-component sensor histidine kinase
MAKNRLQTVLAVPLSVRDKVIGVLACYGEGKRPFSTEQHGLLTTLANQTALAIENGRLVTNTAVVREMHHRIKNNLQTVAMLMQMQLPDAERLDTHNVLETNIHRIRSIASVHEVLSESGFRLVDVKDVIQRISQTMATTMVQPDKSIQIHITGEPLQLPSKEATALTLVVNELLQNSLEHAFTGRQAGVITVLFSQSVNGISVIVRDDGVGMADDYQPNLGLEIAETLVEDDLNGRLSFHSLNPGTEVRIYLPPLQN